MWVPELVGGHLAVDLVNTVSWRGDPRRTIDRIATPEELQRWLRAVGLSFTAGKEKTLSAVRGLRESVHGLLTSYVAASPASAEDLDALRRATLDARRHATAAGLPLRWTITAPDLDDVPRLLALAAEDLLSSEQQLKALKRCDGNGCGWFFLDTSRSHTRRWCSATDCGNRERVRRHYARKRGSLRA